MNTLKEMVIKNKRVKFQFYKGNNLWYATECGFEFPVPISDIGTATFMAEDKALLFMRYIKPQIALIEKAEWERESIVGIEYNTGKGETIDKDTDYWERMGY